MIKYKKIKCYDINKNLKLNSNEIENINKGAQCSGITFPSQGKGLGFESRCIHFFEKQKFGAENNKRDDE